MIRRKKTCLRAGALTAILAAILSPMLGSAQDYEDAPAASDLEALLNVDSTLFNATIAQPSDEDLIELGRLVAMGGAENGGSGMACITCHGAEGQGDGSGAFPRQTGQPAWYMYKQLMDYASGARPNRVMSGIAQRLTAVEMEAVSANYALMQADPLSPVGEMPGTLLQWGGQLAAVGSAERGIPACVNCHGPNGTGLSPAVPYLAGQYADYMELQLQLWRAGVRDNDPMNVMSSIALRMTDEDMRAVSEYYARVRPHAAQALVVTPAPDLVE